MVFILIFVTIAGLFGCGETTSAGTTISFPICTPDSPMVNVYRAPLQPWANEIFETAFPPIPTPIPPNPPMQFNEQQILGARYAAFQKLTSETKRWSHTEIVKLNDSRETKITVTYLSPELLQAIFLNEVLKNRFPTYGFQDQLQSVLNNVAQRDELLFLLTVISTDNNTSPIRHTIKIPIQEMVMHNAENLTIMHRHNDHNLEQEIDASSDPVFGYLGYPLSLVTANQCNWVLDPKYNANIVITVPFIEVDGVSNETSYFWTIPYAPLISPIMPTITVVPTLPPEFDQSLYLMLPSPKPPSDINQANYWQDFGRFIWGQVTLGNY
jgi:hypothetical protein